VTYIYRDAGFLAVKMAPWVEDGGLIGSGCYSRQANNDRVDEEVGQNPE